MLIEIDTNVIINTNQIQTVEELPSVSTRGGRSRVTFADGRTLVVSRGVAALSKFTGVILPAPPGYQAIRAVDEEGEPFFATTTVLAFRYDGLDAGPLFPITDEGQFSDGTIWGLIRPDGTVTDYDREHDSVEIYKRRFAEECAELRRKAAA
ncbi:hypothetical protein [uncultured Enterovirga sp.]|uniref:hypothetical protein n=1 Tax=uncultured Enterovirga sp. TaxID=2026352 RepID=UPI0035CA76A8